MGPFLEQLARQLRDPLPGSAAWRSWIPELAYGRHGGPIDKGTRTAAVVAILFESPDDGRSRNDRKRNESPSDRASAIDLGFSRWRMPLIVRPDTVRHHSGQLALPGGAVDPGETPLAAAIRECGEELGVAAAKLTILGALSPIYVFASDFLVYPFVAVLADELNGGQENLAGDSFSERWSPAADEVAAVVEVSLAELATPSLCEKGVIRRRGLEFEAPYLRLGSRRLWGATAMILSELLAVAEKAAERT